MTINDRSTSADIALHALRADVHQYGPDGITEQPFTDADEYLAAIWSPPETEEKRQARLTSIATMRASVIAAQSGARIDRNLTSRSAMLRVGTSPDPWPRAWAWGMIVALGAVAVVAVAWRLLGAL